MKHIKTITSLVIFGLFLIFAIQNNSNVDVTFLGINFPQVPLFVVIIVIFVAGFLLGRITEWFSSVFDSKKNSVKKENK